MNRRRWQHLDRDPPPARDAVSKPSLPLESPASPQAASAPAPSPAPGLSAKLRAAQTYYRLGHPALAAELAREVLDAEEADGGAHHLLGLALARLGQSQEAMAALSRAVTLTPGDPAPLAALLSVSLLNGAPVTVSLAAAEGPAGELAGALAWVEAQALLTGDARAAAACFSQAAERFARYSSPETLGERVVAAYLGAAVSYLAAGQPALAQRAFSTLIGGVPVPEAALSFARQLYELATLFTDLDASERLDTIAPLVALVLRARLRTVLYDGTAPVVIRWEHLPALAGGEAKGAVF